jgi:vancomycin resistance protein YoaR
MTTDTQSVTAVPSAGRPFSWRRAALGFGITLFAILAFATAFAAAYVSLHEGRVLPGVSVGGVSISGLDRGGAQAALAKSLPDVGSGSLTVKIGNQSQIISYADIDRAYETDTMLDEAFSVGRGGTPLDQVGEQLRAIGSDVSVPVAVTYDTHKLASRISAIAAAAHVDPVDATINRPNGQYSVNAATNGQSVDAQALLAQAVAALNNISPTNTTASIQPTQIAPTVSTAQAQAAVDRANAVDGTPLTVTVAGQTQTIDPGTIDGWMHLDPAGTGQWNLTIEHAPIDQLVALLKAGVDVQVTNAGYTFHGLHAVVTPEAPGSALDATAASSAIYNALTSRASGSSGDTVALSMTTVAPTFTSTQAQALVTKVRRLGTWTTHYISSSHNGNSVNIERPTKLINGTVVQPGQVFSFLGVAGPISLANGYTNGAAIVHGNTDLSGVLGGGLCSASTTLFNAALRAGFQIDARRNHAYYITRYPVGLDATIWTVGNYAQDMSFTNDSQYPILIRGINGHNVVTYSIYGVPDGRHVQIMAPKTWNPQPAWTDVVYTSDTTIVQPGQHKQVEWAAAGFNASVERIVTAANGTVLHDDTFRSSYSQTIGKIYIGWQPGDPPAGTVVQRGKPAGA